VGPFDAVLFDNDGVLVDSHVLVVEAWSELSDRFGLDYERLAVELVGRRAEDTLSQYLSGEQLAAAVEQLERIETDIANRTPAMAGASDLLDSLTIPWTVVTSAALPLAQARWAGAGLQIPEAVVSSESVANGKPDPEPYLAGCTLLDVDPSSVLVFEDAPSGGQAAVAAGCTVIAVGAVPWHLDPAARVNDLTQVHFDPTTSTITVQPQGSDS
jgi:sugar-phosphatase